MYGRCSQCKKSFATELAYDSHPCFVNAMKMSQEELLDSMSLKKFMTTVVLELQEMKKIGIRVPAKALKMAKDQTVMAEYTNMKHSECADLLINLS